MAKIRLPKNLDDVITSFEPVPANDYKVEITDREIRDANAGPCIFWVAEIFDDEEYSGRKVFFNTSLAEQALWKLKQLLEAIGVTWDEEGFDDEDCLHAQLGVTVEVGENDRGEPRNEVTAFFALT